MGVLLYIEYVENGGRETRVVVMGTRVIPIGNLQKLCWGTKLVGKTRASLGSKMDLNWPIPIFIKICEMLRSLMQFGKVN